MPLLTVAAGRAMPDMAIGYITRKDKARYIDVQNVLVEEDYSGQFRDAAARFGKYTDYGESITTSNSLPTARTKQTRSWCKSMQRLVRKRCLKAASAS